MFEFLNIFGGLFFSMLPYSILCLVPFWGGSANLRVSKKRVYLYLALFSAYLLLESIYVYFAGLGLDTTTYILTAVKLIFSISLMFMIMKVKASKLIYVFLFTAVYATCLSCVASHLEAIFFPEYHNLYNQITHNLFHFSLLCLTMPFMWRFYATQMKTLVGGEQQKMWRFIWISPAVSLGLGTYWTAGYDVTVIAGQEFLIRILIITLIPYVVNYIVLKSVRADSKQNWKKSRFPVFSAFLFLVIALIASVAYILSAREINRTYVTQHLNLSEEAVKLSLSSEISAELALIRKLGDSSIIRAYFAEPENPVHKAYAFSEFELYQQHSTEGIVFWVNDIDKLFYATGTEPYLVDPANPVNYWYDLTLYNTVDYNFNINYNPEMDMINLWINVPVFGTAADGGQVPLGLLGTGLNLSRISGVVTKAYMDNSRDIVAYLYNQFDEITIAADFALISGKVHIDEQLGEAGEAVLNASALLTGDRSESFIYGDYMYQVGSVSAIKDWYIVLLHPLPGLLATNQPMNIVFFGMLFLILLLFVVMNIFVARSERALSEQNVRLAASNRAVEEANKSLQAANVAKTKFLASMSHEIRTPMNAIMGVAQIELAKAGLAPEYAEALGRIHSSGGALLGIINDILDMSKIETGKMELLPAPYDVPSLINDTVQLNIVRIGSKPINLSLDIEESLPLRLIGDELRLKQIMSNLLSNAIKYTDAGQVKLSLRHQATDEGIILTIIVEDTGQGMKPEDLEKLFSEYSRFNLEANKHTEGTGIGLQITKSLVELMDGSIKAESSYGEGSRFTVLLKQEAVDDEVMGTQLVEQLKNFSFSSMKAQSDTKLVYETMSYGRVLIVDDVETNLYVASGLMQPYGLQIDTVESGFAALDKVEGGASYDIIFMDHMMPEMDGVETNRRLRAGGYTAPVVALTANAIVGQAEQFIENGFDDFISKPIDVRQLDAVLKQFIRDRQPPSVLMAEAALNTVQREAAEVANKTDDMELLYEQIPVLMRAAAEYDDDLAEETMDMLLDGNWSKETGELLNKLYDLVLRGDLEDALCLAEDGLAGAKDLRLAGIDVTDALIRLDLAWDSYIEIVQMTLTNLPGNMAKLDAYMENAAIGDFKVLVHGMKGTLQVVGATKEGEFAARLETDAANGVVDVADYQAFRVMLEKFTAAVGAVLEGISEM